MLRIGMVVDNRYKILREIGRGGTSCVYLAENIRLHNYWAIKEVYKSGVTSDGAKYNMLIAKSSILTKLRHPGLPSIIDILSTPKSYLIVMEYIEGVSLDKVLAQRGVCSEKDVVKWGQQLCDVLSYLHSQRPSIIYRDMKPANVMLKPDGNIVLIDFGMAREFKKQNQHDTTYLGTHGYAAPEQYNDKRQSDVRTDIYSLGVTLYHLVTGHDPCLPPYGINSIRTHNPALSNQLDTIIQKCTKLEPEQRFQSAFELNNALKSVGSTERIAVDFNDEPKKKNNKWMWLLALVPVIIIAVIIVAVSSIKNTTEKYFDLFGNIGNFIMNEIDASDDATLYFEQDVYIDEPDEREYYTFVPEKTGYYDIYSVSGEVVPVIWLSDSDDNLIDKDNTSGEYTEFSLHCWLRKGETYYIETTLYDRDPYVPATGSYWIYVEYSE